MKESELRMHAWCSLCRKPILSTGLPLFWRVTIERFGVDLNAMRRQDGLASLIGNTHLATVMGPNEDMATPMMDAATVTVCESCAVSKNLPVAALAETGS